MNRLPRISGRFRGNSGVTLLEVMIAMIVVSLASISTTSLITFLRMHNDYEQERARAHQIVSEEIELAKFDLYPRLRTGSDVRIWDNATPLDTSDDTNGEIDVIVRDAYTGAQLTAAPVPATLVQLEVTLRWNPRGRLGGSKEYRESIMTLIAP